MIVVYATDKNGEGHVMEIGRLESIEEFEFRVGMFSPDVVISFSETIEPEKDN